ncbi:hypothetical protein BYT27DRAFT_7209024 [Phlegmacium glaucopus]|nr:hypothetical protein BYT27DRAFT_7209024 [Phlegmacium glaucopus]
MAAQSFRKSFLVSFVLFGCRRAWPSLLEETDAFSIAKLRDLENGTREAFDGVFVHMSFEERLLEGFVDEVNAKLIERAGTAGHVLGSGKIKETDESGEVAELLIDVFVQPGKEKGVKGLVSYESAVSNATGWIPKKLATASKSYRRHGPHSVWLMLSHAVLEEGGVSVSQSETYKCKGLLWTDESL